MAIQERLRYTAPMSFPPVTIYTTKTCGYCKATKALLTEHAVSYKEIDVGTDRLKAREMIEMSGQMGVPVTLIGEEKDQQVIIGFDKGALSLALGL